MRALVLCALLVLIPSAISAQSDDLNRKMCMILLHKALQDQTVPFRGLKAGTLKEHDLRLPALTTRLVNRGQPSETLVTNCVFSYKKKDKRHYLHLLHSGETLVVVRTTVDAIGTTSFP